MELETKENLNEIKIINNNNNIFNEDNTILLINKKITKFINNINFKKK